MKFYLIVGVVFCSVFSNIYTTSAQQNVVPQKTVVVDSINAPLQGVQIAIICQNDTTQVQSNSSGEFQYTAKPGTKLFLKKKGYAWEIVRVNETAIKKIVLRPHKFLAKKDIGEKNMANTEMIFDGHIVPQNEWDDAMNVNEDEIADFGTLSAKITGGKNRIIFTSK